MNNNDSLDVITNDVFFEASANLERSGKENTLILVITGSWIEGLYIATQLITDFKTDTEIALRIAEQKYSLENLLAYFDSIGDDETLEPVKQSLFKLQESFDAIAEVKAEAPVNAGKTKTIGSNSELKITLEQYQDIAQIVSNLRMKIIDNN